MPAHYCIHFLFTIFIYVLYIYKYILYIYATFYIFHGYDFIISKNVYFTFLGLFFLAVIQLCILYTRMVSSNKILRMYSFKCYTSSFCESLPEGEGESKQGLSPSLSCKWFASNLKGAGKCWALVKQRCHHGRWPSPDAQPVLCGLSCVACPVWSYRLNVMTSGSLTLEGKKSQDALAKDLTAGAVGRAQGREPCDHALLPVPPPCSRPTHLSCCRLLPLTDAIQPSLPDSEVSDVLSVCWRECLHRRN